MTARHHHYLSQCYLKGFTSGGSKNSKLVVIDFFEKKRFETIPRNVGGIRDFNRIDAEGVDPNVLEKALADFESKAASSLKKIGEGHPFEDEAKEHVINLIAMLAVRSPEQRENWRAFQAQIAERVMDLALASEERWLGQMQKMREDGVSVNESITYDDMKKFHESKAYTISVNREHHIQMEFVGVNAVLPHLFERNWLLVRATEQSGPFVTTDAPVNISWNDSESVPPLYRTSPGYGMKGTQVCFALSKEAALIGEFDGRSGTIEASKELVAALNANAIRHVRKQMYAPKIGFYFTGKSGDVLDGTKILQQVQNA